MAGSKRNKMKENIQKIIDTKSEANKSFATTVKSSMSGMLNTGGRPKKPAGDIASESIPVWLTEAEKKKVMAYCKGIHMSFSGFMKVLMAKEGVL
jgi:hypothetical protein